MNEQLKLKAINDILGESFIIPNYQRGYRWTPQQVKDLLNDIWAFASSKNNKAVEFYCLQPVVVKTKKSEDEGFEVIDGQQRLTTLYLIIEYLSKEFLKVDSLMEEYGKDIYSIRYKTRPRSGEFLKNIYDDKSNIDFYYMSLAYNTIKEWFTSGENTKDRTDRNKFLDTLLGKKEDDRSVQIIWYIVGQKIDGKELFTRLNIGKIPLTNSELIKALFLSESSFKGDSEEDVIRKKIEISQIWDEIEHNLNDEDFWSFVTNEKQKDYSTKIELLFDMISRKSQKEIDPYFTFLHFFRESTNSNQSLWDLWLKIEQYYLTLRQWYKDKNLYHKVGYLITIGENMQDLIELSMREKKDVFEEKLDKKIKESLNFDLEDLNYEKESDHKKIEKVLLLFNIESIRSNLSITEFYPFKFHKNTNWNLEHIHAQNSEGIDKTKKEPWLIWLKHHEYLIRELLEDENVLESDNKLSILLKEIEGLNYEKITWETFSALAEKIIRKFSETIDEHFDEMHSISNLALLSHPDNVVLSNSVFEVKRRAIIELDKKGSYIPVCTKRVFLKYYNDKPSTQQYYFWGKEDRTNYIKEIKSVLEDYLPEGESID